MTVPRLTIVNGRLIDPFSGTDRIGDLFLDDGRIASWDQMPPNFTAERVIDATGYVVCPGFIDLAARLREPGGERKATLRSETTAAAKAGITTLCCPPDTQPVIDTPAVVELIQEVAEKVGKARVIPIGALTRGLRGSELSEMFALKKAGCPAVGNGDQPLANLLIWRRALEYAGNHGLRVIVQPVDRWLAQGGYAHEGLVASRLGLPGIPATAETTMIASLLCLVEQIGVPVHFSQLSCGRSAQAITVARQQGSPVTGDVAIHQLHFTEERLENFDPNFYVLPPLRTLADRAALRQAVASGDLDAVCSAHQPHEPEAKQDSFMSAEPGMSNLELLLPLMLELVNGNVLSLIQAIARITSGPAAILGFIGGSLTPGAPADICVFDANAKWIVNDTTWLSAGQNTPYWGTTLQGRVCYTILGGRIVYEAI